MQWWLTVFFFVNGSWVAGSAIDGWDPRPFATEAQCLERKDFAERECRDHPLEFEAVWICSKGVPAKEPPVKEPAIEC